MPQAGFELGSLGPQAGVLPIEPPLLVVYFYQLSGAPPPKTGGNKIKTAEKKYFRPKKRKFASKRYEKNMFFVDSSKLVDTQKLVDSLRGYLKKP